MTSFPTSTISWATPVVDSSSIIYASHINNLYNEVIAIENSLRPHVDCKNAVIDSGFRMSTLVGLDTNITNPSGDTYPVCDMWEVGYGADGGSFPTVIHSQRLLTNGDITGYSHLYRINVNGAGTSLGSYSQYQLKTWIENGTRLLCGLNKKVTLSFWGRTTISGTKRIGVFLYQNYGTGGSPTSQEAIYGNNFTLTSTWTKFTCTFTTNTLVGKTFGTALNDALCPVFLFTWGSGIQSYVGASSAETFVGSGDIEITGCTLYSGEIDYPIQYKSIGDEIRDCLRYYRITGNGSVGCWDSATAVRLSGTMEIPMRIAPTVSLTSNAPTIMRPSKAGVTGSSSAITPTSTTKSWNVYINGFTSQTTLEMLIMTGDFLILDSRFY